MLSVIESDCSWTMQNNKDIKERIYTETTYTQVCKCEGHTRTNITLLI